MRKTAVKEEIYSFVQKSENRELIKLSMCGITFPDKSYRISRPNSHISCIEYIEQGGGIVNIGNKHFYASEGDSYFLEESNDQLYYSDKSRPWKKYFINFSGRLSKELAEGYGISGVAHFCGLDLREELQRIIELGKINGEDNTKQIIIILNEIMFKMRAHSLCLGVNRTLEQEMKDFLDTKITSKFKIDELCRHISRSESQTIRIFKKAYGVTPYTYVLGKKTDLAKKLLCDTNLSIKEIADKLCFADEYYFSNVFKKKTGVTPSAYRKQES
jgi:AraC-like DNA-binding protein